MKSTKKLDNFMKFQSEVRDFDGPHSMPDKNTYGHYSA
eukprot:CAMPEP_0184312680 /NCGR_PEP_ID=MMETSP1049-20130417/51810_1 /TAXON_ID=77928 /ORGANISM="Proteomonas sulcata, Strain CCMP704" /LENGTH=37 /DNA_ID= /DNA_START= /DNA_END= /DNA_ORIENTATION=